jgi:hypothetical protein
VSSLDRSCALPLRRLGALFSLLGGLAGCQPLDAGASLGEPFTDAPEGARAALQTSAIELADGGTASDACQATTRDAAAILEQNCARCHGGDNPGARQGTPPFDCVLDTDRLVTMVSATVKDPLSMQPARFLMPGAPDRSRIYLRPLNGEMPPPDIIGLPANPRPSVSDLSVLRQWIASCVPQSDSQDEGTNGGDENEAESDPQTATQ